MASKFAEPTPTMIMDMGRWEAAMMACLVGTISEMTPSVSIRRIKYCWECGERVCVWGGELRVARNRK